MSDKVNIKKIVLECPICKQPTAWDDNPYSPLCSSRCQEIDLASWARDGYSIPCNNETPDDEDN